MWKSDEKKIERLKIKKRIWPREEKTIRRLKNAISELKLH